MDHQHIESAAARLEKTAESGDAGALQTQLNNIKPADQLAVIKEMKNISDKKREKDPLLPDIEFVQGTNDKGKDAVSQLTVHSNFSQRTTTMDLDPNSGKVKSEEIKTGTSSEHVGITYDAAGKIDSRTVNEKALGLDQTTIYDGKGRMVSQDKEFAGTHFHSEYEFDAKSGKLIHDSSAITMAGSSAPSTTDSRYDPISGKKVSVELGTGLGPPTHFDIDPDTGLAKAPTGGLLQ